MFSLNYDIGEFIKALGGRDQYESIWLAHKEATEVDRMLLTQSRTVNHKKRQMEKYSTDLRNLISSLRYVAVPKKVYGAAWFEHLKQRR